MRFSKNDASFTALMLAVIIFLSYLLYQNFASRINALEGSKPVGTVIYKHHKVKRKYYGRFVWESVQPETPIFLMDSILTHDQSDAIINLNNGAKVEMDANSLVEIDLINDGLGIKLRKGGITASGNSGKKVMVESKDGTRIDVSKASARLSQDKSGLKVAVKTGQVTVQQKDKAKRTVREGKQLQVDNTGKLTEKSITIQLLSPNDGKIIQTNPKIDSTDSTKNQNFPVTFQWKTTSSSGAVRRFKVFVSQDAGFEQNSSSTIVRFINSSNTSNASAIKIDLRMGAWYWKVEGVDKTGQVKEISHIQSFKIVPNNQIILFTPNDKSSIAFNNSKQTIFFSWQTPWEDAQVVYELASSPNMQSPIRQQKTRNNSFVVTGLKPGKYFWRVSFTLPSSGKQSHTIHSALYSFNIQPAGNKTQEDALTQNTDNKQNNKNHNKINNEQDEHLQKLQKQMQNIRLTFPVNNTLTRQQVARAGAVTFLWTGMKANYYLWTLSEKRLTQKGTRKNVVLRTQKVSGQKLYTPMPKNYYSGTYSWSVEPVIWDQKTKSLVHGPKKYASFQYQSPPPPPDIESVKTKVLPVP